MDRFIAALKRLIPRPVRPVLGKLYHALYRRLIPLTWWLSDHFERTTAPMGLPLPPASLRFRVGESSSAALFFRVGEATAESIREALAHSGSALCSGRVALDFGCGCGRTLMWLVRQFPEVQWHGTDVDREAIEWCHANLPAATLLVNEQLPPLPFSDAMFDFVYGISVFTHLSEAYQRAWLPEMHRILKPGGTLLLSFYGQDVWENLEEAGSIERDGFVFRTSEKLRGIVPDWYQTAFQNQARIVRMLSSHFATVDYIQGGVGYQDLAVARRD